MGKRKTDYMSTGDRRAARRARNALFDFLWKDTIEGYGFWNRIYKRLNRIAEGKKLDPKSKEKEDW